MRLFLYSDKFIINHNYTQYKVTNRSQKWRYSYAVDSKGYPDWQKYTDRAHVERYDTGGSRRTITIDGKPDVAEYAG